LIEELRTFLRMEKSKTEIKIQQEKEKIPVKVSQKKQKKIEVVVDQYQQDKIIVGSLVQLISTKQKGTVESINGKQLTVTFDNLRLKVEREKLQFLK
jgi:hypothetical protein